MSADESLSLALLPIKILFESLGIRYFVGGSVASSFHGAMRSTMDVDVVADIAMVHIAPIVSAMSHEYYISETAIREAVARRSCFNLIHLSTSFKVDVFVNKNRVSDESSFARCSIERLGDIEKGIDVPVATKEDIILAKLEWYRAGNETSERQWNDLSRLLKTNRAMIDWAYANSMAELLNVRDLLDRIVVETS